MSDASLSPELQQEIDSIYEVAQRAAQEFSHFRLEQVQAIVDRVAAAAGDKAEYYADWAVRETGYGDVQAKVAKNLATSVDLLKTYNIADYIEPSIDAEKKMFRIPKPAGVVLAPMPCTNPIMTVNFKVLANLIARNAVILCPHPAAKECSVHAAEFLAEVAECMGAPKGCVQIIREPNIELVNVLMRDPRTSLIMATGGAALVHAAYSSGNPAVGVGAANVPCYVHESADIEQAGAKAVIGNSFDNSLPCTSESVVLADRKISDQLKQAIIAGGGLFVDGEDAQKLRDFLFPNGVGNPAALGKSPQWMGDAAGVAIAEGVKSIVFEIDRISHDEPVSKEKMFPVMGFMTVDGGIEGGVKTALDMLDLMGKGHSAVIHANDADVVARYTSALPVCRIAVNSPGMTGNAGLTTALAETGMVGTGFFGGSSSDENIGPQHLIQHTYVAYDSDPSIQMGGIESALAS
ncbi:aldehyde dehydrogenase family protein [Pseudomaricurvus alkylphenolicus]|jgi:acyl-CoA reductase-like NAD-dependent aldehyde dehydrogenase|uniref:aldehyde dehydrogenase family protein n=1 Tax=Pseudomaricurvus alkylphenolicus TaxID=1306991 RepID=UPI00141E2A8C|nr:aldehyde dehydrogenase family protein [Pseudomaricurvus alkylphenolicus]NIB40180.1 aldehyde dehydrogenase family protein [Pseudomaricurvus alkylphenolicus]